LNFSTTDRKNIKDRAGHKCQICGKTEEELIKLGKVLECDHIISISSCGSNDWETNGQALCSDCHKLKTRKHL
jgi:5-methylcytosine-specific restriction endonuclease McrA